MGLRDRLTIQSHQPEEPAPREEESFRSDTIPFPSPEPAALATRPKPKATQDAMLYSENAEKAVLGAIVLDGSKVMRRVEALIGESSFYLPHHRLLWSVFQSLHFDNEAIDLVTVTQRAMDFNLLDKIGGPFVITDIGTFVQSSSNLDYYVDILRKKAILRELRGLNHQLENQLADPTADPTELVKTAKSSIDRLYSRADRTTEEMSFRSLIEADTKNDPNNVLGYRWLCKGGSCLFVGQSGIGKSSLAAQAGIRWAQGLDLFGVRPDKGRPLKSLFIQAENDEGDLSEMIQGVAKGYPLPEGMTKEDFIYAMEEKIIFHRDAINTGTDFARNAARLIDKHKPDLVWVDPLLSFCGGDISKQEVASAFLRNTINPIALDTGIIWMFLHHTGKPSQDPKSKQNWTDHDFSYAAFGSSELVNWARAVNVLTSIGNGKYELRFAKRGRRAGLLAHGATIENPTYADVIYLQHGPDGTIYWDQIPEPTEEERAQSKKPRGKNSGQFEEKYDPSILEELIMESKGLKPNELHKLAKEQTGMSSPTFWRLWNQLKTSPNLIKKDTGRFYHITSFNQPTK